MKTLVSVWTFCFLLAAPAEAQARVAAVDLETLFNQYWKTGLVRAALKEKAKEFDQTDHQMAADLQKAEDEYQELLADSTNEVLSSAESTKYQRKAADQLGRVKELEYNLAAFEQQASVTMAEQESRARKDLLADILAAIANVAKANGCSLVVDADTQGAASDPSDPDIPPVVLYSDNANDLTRSVLSQLNAGAPVNVSATSQTQTNNQTHY